ncbi:uncharacterized protein LOC126888026 [Diabrotica virgifera virgifera]|uniref:DUF4806 domain-containing protein n=1 Tax=Diabrotica virgifera virgifera TaxID=50390 RepID=A0ABM5KP86_DIAVI|nr:uncharacterized protein LOC126888026 [Diabrotica virgifera virgifera]
MLVSRFETRSGPIFLSKFYNRLLIKAHCIVNIARTDSAVLTLVFMNIFIKSSVFVETDDISVEITDVEHDCKYNTQMLYNMQSLLIEINAKLDELSAYTQQSVEGPVENVLERSSKELPVDTQEELENLEQFLASSENYKSLVQYFAKMGGVNLYDFVKRCLRPVISDTMAMAYSFIGRKGKMNFSKLRLSKAVIESAERSGLQKTRKETEYAVALWLRKAKERYMKQM